MLIARIAKSIAGFVRWDGRDAPLTWPFAFYRSPPCPAISTTPNARNSSASAKPGAGAANGRRGSVIVAIYGGWFGVALNARAHRPRAGRVALLAVLSCWYMSLQHELMHGHPTRWPLVNMLLRHRPARRVVSVRGLSRVASASSRRRASDRTRPRSRKLLRDARAVGERGPRAARRARRAQYLRRAHADRAVVRHRRIVAGGGAGRRRAALAHRRELGGASRVARAARELARHAMRHSVARVRVRRRLCVARAGFGALVSGASRGGAKKANARSSTKPRGRGVCSFSTTTITPCITICPACRGSRSAGSIRAGATPIARAMAVSSCADTANGRRAMRSRRRRQPVHPFAAPESAGPPNAGARAAPIRPASRADAPALYDPSSPFDHIRSRCTGSPPCRCTTSRPRSPPTGARCSIRVRDRLADWLSARGDTLDIVDPGPDLTAFWLRDDVLLSQTCGYPLVHALANRVRLVGDARLRRPRLRKRRVSQRDRRGRACRARSRSKPAAACAPPITTTIPTAA